MALVNWTRGKHNLKAVFDHTLYDHKGAVKMNME